jgi:cytochrome c peroxidase
VSANSKYDSFKLGKANFNAQEQSGYQLFTMHCNRCHTEPLFTNHQFADNGLALNPELNDVGRYRISRKSIDSLKFKVPSLRNLSYTYPYMHDGRFNSLQSVLKHYTKGIVQHPNLDEGLRAGIPLSDKERTDIIAFLLTLNDRSFVFDKQFSQPK